MAKQLAIRPFNVEEIRREFPGLHQEIYGKPLAFLDTAASAQKPRCVLNALQNAYEKEYANIHRGVYYLSDIATRHFEAVRVKVKDFIHAESEKEIVFTKSATEAINLVAQSFGEWCVTEKHNIVISALEHHANIVPWQQLCKRTGATLRVIPVDSEGRLDCKKMDQLIDANTAIVAMTQQSNALGVITPIQEVIDHAHRVGAKVLVDACQSAVHRRVDVQALDCDFLVCAPHKLYGPTGVGILYGKYNLLEAMPPYQTGGEMIESVSFEETTFQKPPLRFEAGTPAIAEVIAFGAGLDFLMTLDWDGLMAHEASLLRYAAEQIEALGAYRIIGNVEEKAGVISFLHDTAHPNDIGAILDRCGVAIRAGHHCAQPLMERLGISATARMSLGVYTNNADIDALIDGLKKVNQMVG